MITLEEKLQFDEYLLEHYKPRKIRKVSERECASNTTGYVKIKDQPIMECYSMMVRDNGVEGRRNGKNSLEKSINEALGTLDKTFQEYMLELIDQKGLNDVDVYKDAHIDRKLFSKIRCDKDYKPSKKTAISLCIGLKLNNETSEVLLKKAGYVFSNSSIADCVIRCCIEKGMYDLTHINELLESYNQPLLMV